VQFLYEFDAGQLLHIARRYFTRNQDKSLTNADKKTTEGILSG
jgi:hypothetical protein